MRRKYHLVFFVALLHIGCRERSAQVHADDNIEITESRRLESRLQKTKEAHSKSRFEKRVDDVNSLDSIIAACEKLKKGDAAGNINVLELVSAYRQLASIDPKLALDHFSDPKSFYSIGPALAGVLEIVAAQNSALVTQWLTESLTGYKDISQAAPLVSMTLEKLAAADPEKALAAFKGLEIPTNLKVSAIHALFRGLATSSPSEVIKLSASIDPSLVPSALRGAVYGLCEKDPATARTIAFSISDPEVRRQALDTVFAAWFQSDSALAGEELTKMDPKQVEELLVGGAQNPKSTFYMISQSNPGMLISLLDGVYPTSLNRDVFMKAVARTVSGEPERTFEMISRLPEGDLALDLYREAYSALSREDLDGAMSMLTAEKNPAIRATALTQIAGSIGNRGMKESLRFLDQLKDSEEKSVVFSAAFNSICHSDLESAAKYLTNPEDQNIRLSPQERDRGYQVVGYRLASEGLDNAMNWMSQLPEPEQSRAMTGIAVQMAERNINGLGDYLNSMTKNEIWAAGARVFISSIESTDTQTASKWKQALKEYEGK